MVNNRVHVGIDPGKNGCLAIIGLCNDISYFEFKKIGNEVDLALINEVFSSIEKPCHCVIEDVHAVFGSSANSTFEFGRINGALEALLIANKIPFTKVQPKTWQKQMFEGVSIQTKPSSTGKTRKIDTKAMAKVAATRIFPNQDFRRTERSRVVSHDKIDSLLMAEYSRRNFD